MRSSTLCLLGTFFLLACGDDGGESPAPVSLSDAGARECIDKDGDYFGQNCEDGRDCDDDDPDITDECFRCRTPSTGCPCEPGTKPITDCKPDDKRVVVNGVSGTVKCDIGTRYCRNSVYSACEALEQYSTFVPD